MNVDENVTETRAVDDQSGEERRVSPLTGDELAHLPIVKPGTQLEPSGVYVDLNNPERGPFKALAGQEAGSGDRYVARRDVDFELWTRLVEHEPVESTATQPDPPQSANESIEAYYERGEAGVGINR
jgi:hypothetical protein